MTANAIYLGIVRNDEFLLSTVGWPGGSGAAVEQRRYEAMRQAECYRRGWQSVYPGDNLRIEKLARRDCNGWEIARRKGRKPEAMTDAESHEAMAQ